MGQYDNNCSIIHIRENVIFVFNVKNKNKLLNKIKNTDSFTRDLGYYFNFCRFFSRQNKNLLEISFSTFEDEVEILEEKKTMKRKDLFGELYKRLGNKIFEKIHILEETETKKEIMKHISSMNKLKDTKYTIQWIESPLYNMLQFSKQKEINSVIYDFINHPLFDRNVLGLINDY
jgi:hypothetical protein